jgi:hypothetical protein
MMAAAEDIFLTIDEDGTLKLPQSALNALGTRQVKLTVQDGLMTVKPRPKALKEIEDPEERAAAVHEWMSHAGRRSGVSWPTDYNLRDDLYD